MGSVSAKVIYLTFHITSEIIQIFVSPRNLLHLANPVQFDPCYCKWQEFVFLCQLCGIPLCVRKCRLFPQHSYFHCGPSLQSAPELFHAQFPQSRVWTSTLCSWLSDWPGAVPPFGVQPPTPGNSLHLSLCIHLLFSEARVSSVSLLMQSDGQEVFQFSPQTIGFSESNTLLVNSQIIL